NSYQNRSGAHSMISAALASARAIAAKEQHYAGIRFQQDLLHGRQYMIFIIHDTELVDSSGYNVPLSGFHALEGSKPIKLPDQIDVMDRMVGASPDDSVVSGSEAIDEEFEIRDMTTFSVIFSPAGKLVIRNVQVLRRNSADKTFNDPSVQPMFEDDYDNATFPLQQEPSRNRFVICDRTQFDELNLLERFDYLSGLEQISINPYMGTIISPE
ncbi:MAG: hypothetical protein ACYSWQ_00115, partial [Planctomycetota bacterium]